MFTYLYSLIWGVEETNSLCPNSFNTMPSGKFHNFAIELCDTDDDEPTCTI
jgi:hypothetical protein